MSFNCALPDKVKEILKTEGKSNGEIRYAVQSDLALNRQFGTSYLIVTDQQVVVAETDNVAALIPLAEIEEIRIDELFGSSALTARLNGSERRLLYYTKAMIPEFGVMARVLNDILRGKQPELPEPEGSVFCPKCKKPLPERGGQCPTCVHRFVVLRRLLELLQPYRAKLVLVVACTFVTVLAQMAPPYVTKRIVDEVIETRRPDLVWHWIGAMLGAWLVYFVAKGSIGLLSTWLAARLIADLRSRLHNHLQHLRMSFFGRREDGEIVSRVMGNTQELQNFLIDGLPYLFVNVMSFVAIACILISLDLRLALLIFIPVPVFLGGVKWLWAKLVPLFQKRGSRRSGLYTILGESIRGIKAVKAATQENERSRRFDHKNLRLFKTVVRLERYWLGFQEGSFLVMTFAVTSVWFFAARRIASGDSSLTLGDLLAFVGYIWLFYGPLQWFTVILNWMSVAFAGAERIFSMLDTKPEIYDSPTAIHISRIKGAIEMQDIHFSYERGKEIIKGVNLDIEAGEMIGLVGKSGAGKSTIINLICRFYDLDSGMIRIDGHPITELKLVDLRRQIGIVMQEPFIFHASIFENIKYGTPEATFDDVLRAARAANANDFILDKEYGYDTLIGASEIPLSGGERQRIAIARAILNDPAILILDEATSSVDTETEKAIQEAIGNLVANRTTIAIAHRLATLRHANRLVVVDEGQIAEIGTHEELLDCEGIYYKLVQSQTELLKLRSAVWSE